MNNLPFNASISTATSPAGPIVMPARTAPILLDFMPRPTADRAQIVLIGGAADKSQPFLRANYYPSVRIFLVATEKAHKDGRALATHGDITLFLKELEEFAEPCISQTTDDLFNEISIADAYRVDNCFIIKVKASAEKINESEIIGKIRLIVGQIRDSNPDELIIVSLPPNLTNILPNLQNETINLAPIASTTAPGLGDCLSCFYEPSVLTVRLENSKQTGRAETFSDEGLEILEEQLGEIESLARTLDAEFRITYDPADRGCAFATKKLGRFHQVVSQRNPKSAVTEARKSPPEIPTHLYSRAHGTRYFFLDDILQLGNSVTDQIDQNAPTQKEAMTPSKIQAKVTLAIENLSKLFKTRNSGGKREGMFFLIKLHGDRPQLLTEQNILDDHKDFICDLAQTAKNLVEWDDFKIRIPQQLRELETIIRAQSDPQFHRIDLTNPRFLKIAHQVLIGNTDNIDIGEDFSTRLTPLNCGRFKNDALNTNRTFQVTTSDQIQIAILSWLFGQTGERDIDACGSRINPHQADYVLLYQDDLTTGFETHPTNEINRFGQGKETPGFFIEVGKRGQSPDRFVLCSNPGAPQNIAQRKGPGMEKIKKDLRDNSGSEIDCNHELSRRYTTFRREQHALVNKILTALKQPKVKLADPQRIIEVPGFDDSGEGSNCILRRAVHGRRAHHIDPSFWTEQRLRYMIEPLADLSVVGIVSQFPGLWRRDINIAINRDRTDNNDLEVTLLSTADTFCHASGHTDINSYTSQHIPALYGNHIARWVASLAFDPSLANNPTLIRARQRDLISQYVQRLANRLHELQVNDLDLQTANPTLQGNTDFDLESSTAPIPLDISNYLELSRQTIKMPLVQIQSIAKAIERRALQELNLIRLILKRVGQKAMHEAAQVDAFYSAISSLFEGQLLAPIKDRETIVRRHIRLIRQPNDVYQSLALHEVTACITLLNLGTRISELMNSEQITDDFIAIFRETAGNEEDFYLTLANRLPSINLSRETIISCHRSISILKSTCDNLGKKGPIEPLLQSLGALGQEIGGPTSPPQTSPPAPPRRRPKLTPNAAPHSGLSDTTRINNS